MNNLKSLNALKPQMINSKLALNASPNKTNYLRYAKKKIHPISLVDLRNHDAKHYFLKAELPIRYTQIAKLLDRHVDKLLDKRGDKLATSTSTKPLEPVVERYLQDLNLVSQAPLPMNNLVEFTAIVKQLLQNHQETMDLFTKSIKKVRNFPKDFNYHDFFERFYLLNLSNELLLQEHVSIVEKGVNLVRELNPVEVVKDCVGQVRANSLSKYGVCPDFEIAHKIPKELKTLYVESHLKTMLNELLTNAVTATIRSRSNTLVRVKIVAGEEDIAFKISDEANGITLRKQNKLFEFNSYAEKKGLNYATLLAKYFGGSLEIVSMENHGTDAYLHLFRHNDVYERVPLQIEEFGSAADLK